MRVVMLFLQQPVYYSDVLIYGDCFTSLDTKVVVVVAGDYKYHLVNRDREAPAQANNESISTNMATVVNNQGNTVRGEQTAGRQYYQLLY